MEATTTSGVRHVVSKTPITFDSLSTAKFQKEGTLTAQIRQVITTDSYYPSKKTSNELQAGLFSTEDFGFEEQHFESTETRIAWILVPAGVTEPVLLAKLAAANAAGGCIYRVLSNAPILSEDQKYAIKEGNTTLDTIANAQVVRFPENDETLGNGTAGKVALDKAGNVQYRKTYFWNSPMVDQDVRGKVAPYQSAEIQAELAGASVMQGQTL